MGEHIIEENGIKVRVTILPEGTEAAHGGEWQEVEVFIDGDCIPATRTDGEPYGPVYSAIVKGSPGEDTGVAAPATEPAATPVPEAEEPKDAVGWYGPPQSKRFHYFDEDSGGRSLCGKWLVLGLLKPDMIGCAYGPANGDCAACARKLAAKAAKIAAAIPEPGE